MSIYQANTEKALLNRKNKDSLYPHQLSDKLGSFVKVRVDNSFVFDIKESIFSIGSCFARNIDDYLLEYGFNVPQITKLNENILPTEDFLNKETTKRLILNRFNPYSMYNDLRFNLDPEYHFDINEHILQIGKDSWCDINLTTRQEYSLKRDECIKIRELVNDTYKMVPSCKVIIITLGVIECWHDNKLQIYLNQCPHIKLLRKFPERFTFKILDYAEILNALEQIHSILSKFGHPDFKIIITVSPIPLYCTFSEKDVISANLYSKSTLRAATEAFIANHNNVDYFPSYEVTMLSDKSKAFNSDGTHPTQDLIKFNVLSLLENYAPFLDLKNLKESINILDNKLENFNEYDRKIFDKVYKKVYSVIMHELQMNYHVKPKHNIIDKIKKMIYCSDTRQYLMNKKKTKILPESYNQQESRTISLMKNAKKEILDDLYQKLDIEEK